MQHKRKIQLAPPHGDRIYAKLAEDIGRELARALNAEAKTRNLTKAAIADAIKADRGFVTKAMSGSGNLTLRSISALLSAMGHELDVRAHPIEGTRVRDVAERSMYLDPSLVSQPTMTTSSAGQVTVVTLPQTADAP